ncbi:MAG: NAD-dependent epimerase/dehydratase family protein [Bacteroidales bacterium]|jgi:nucleoside-diphosphate-sugar epimerase|nr:NAD-dependent epimerase/dehydratase family protein [Bacteroidales bacterium]
MKILIIGGTNFIGPVVVEKLLNARHTVTLFHRSSVNISDNCTHIKGDCGNTEDLRIAIRSTKPDVIVHMIAYFQSHISALEKALDNCPMKTVILSSADVYKGYEILVGLSEAEPVPVPFTEESPLRNILYPYRGRLNVDYAHNYDKIPVEQATLQSPLLNTVIIRLGMVYGKNDPNRRFADPVHKMASGVKSIEIHKDMSCFRACKCYVENVAHGITLAIERGQVGEIYNLTDEWVFTEREWLELLAKKLNWTGNIVVLDEKYHDMNTRQHFVLDTAKIRKSLGYNEIVSVDRALSKTIEWELSRS